MRGSAEAVVVVSYRWECRGVKGVRAAGCSAEAVVVSHRHHHPCTDTTTHESAPPMSGKLAHYGAIPTEERKGRKEGAEKVYEGHMHVHR